MNQMNLVYDIPFCFLKTHRNIILRLGLGRPNNLFNTGSPTDIIFSDKFCTASFIHRGNEN
jgi:hypothetical protein